MLLALHPVDYGVLALYLAAMVAIGFYFSREQHTSQDFFLAGRSMGWFPIGLSVMATLLSALSYTGVPGAAYYAGFKYLLMPIAVWLTVPLLTSCVLPLYSGLQLYSVYEYLEMRFDAVVRFCSSLAFVFWRLLWLGGVLYAPCKVLVVAAGLEIPVWVLIVLLGAASTAYTFLGGMKAVLWTDVIQSFVMVTGLVMIIGGVWLQLDGGPLRVWQAANELGRTDLIETEFRWDSYWTAWGAIPHFALSMLSFYIADQITAQRFLTAKNLREARRSFYLNCISVSVMIPALAYTGLCLAAFYHDHPDALRPKWIANVDARATADPRTGASATDPQTGEPLIAWDAPTDEFAAENLEQLVAQERLLRPNRREPFTDVEQLYKPDQPGQLDHNRLAARLPPLGSAQTGEVILHNQAQDELLPWFITSQLPWGVAGLILAALFSASMSSMDSGLNSICTLLIMDYHRRLGWGRQWLAARRGKRADELSEEDELHLARPMVLLIGVAATVFSLFVSRIDDIFSIMIAVVNTFGGPLLAVFLLALFTRRCTARGALTALLAGTLFTVWMAFSNKYDSMAWLWPFEQRLNDIWPLIFGVAFTLVVGVAVSFFAGRPKSKEELRGLVFGIGKLGETK